MKKIALIIAAGLLFGGAAFAKEENGALGFGVIGEGNGGTGISTGNIRGNLFLDVGYQLAGPVFYGFEFQGDVKQMGMSQEQVNTTDATYFDFGDGNAVVFVKSNDYTNKLTLWDLDFSPRGYLSFDLGEKVQLLAFGGLNYNWQTLDVETTVNKGSYKIGGKTYDNNVNNPNGNVYRDSKNLKGGNWSLVAGFRVSVGAFYVDYTRFLDDSKSQVSWNSFNKDRFGLGINLRF